jgi:hypothetical protein
VVGSSVARCCPAFHFFHPFLWTKQDGMVDLGILSGFGLGTFAAAINDRLRVIGTYDGPALGFRSFSWTARDGMVDLGTLGGPRVGASALNNSDQVVGSSSLAQRFGFSRARACVLVDAGRRDDGPWHARRPLERSRGHKRERQCRGMDGG